MRKIILTVMASLLSCSAAQAFWPEATDSSLEVGFGYRTDELKWKTQVGSVVGLDGVQSHLKWKNLNIWQVEAKGEYVTCDNIYLRATGDYGWIVSGKNKYSTTIGSESPVEVAHSKTRGHVYDVDVAIGYQFKLCDDSFAVTPVVGYSWKAQHLKHRHWNFGGVTVDTPIASSSSSSDDDSSSSSSGAKHGRLNTRWNGPFVGVDFDYRIDCEWSLFLGYEFHFAKYHARAPWNVDSSLVHGFNHRAKRAYGHDLDFGVKWDVSDWTIALKGGLQFFHAKRGRQRALVSEIEIVGVDTKTYGSIPLRHVKWGSASVSVDVGMAF
jgi:hypothetical protein